MRLIKQIIAGLLLFWGLPISLWAIVDAINPETDNQEGAIAALIIFGLPPTALGGWLFWDLNQQQQTRQVKSDRELEMIFLQLLQENQGIINPIIFATKTECSLEESKQYLDEKAVQLNGLYEVNEQGGIEYRFPL